MFDDVATRFDHLMVDELDYRGHLHLRTFADTHVPGLKAPLRILDLGCGTGLVGNAFKDLTAGGRLDGIDLAPRMIEVARKRGIYDELILGDLETGAGRARSVLRPDRERGHHGLSRRSGADV
jgi:predicted TPR repeat methyltransferase